MNLKALNNNTCMKRDKQPTKQACIHAILKGKHMQGHINTRAYTRSKRHVHTKIQIMPQTSLLPLSLLPISISPVGNKAPKRKAKAKRNYS
jgi:hypothetical protein